MRSRGLILTALALAAVPSVFGQRSRINGPIQSVRRIALPGHVRPEALPQNDEGPLDPNTVLSDVTLVLRPSAEQQAALDQLLKEQQDPTSPNFHHWLSPDEFADRFGASTQDIEKISTWIKQQNLEVSGVARGRNSIQIRGVVANVQSAFATQLHNYRVNGRMQFANATNPSVPAELDAIVTSIEGLDDFHLEPRGFQVRAEEPESNYTSGTGRHSLAPDDFAVIYNVKPLYEAGLDGTGQTIVIAGQSRLDMADVRRFRTRFGLTAVDPESILVPGQNDPGVIAGDQGEANLDLQWAGAIARKARLVYVYAPSVMTAVRYAIDQNLAPVISVSYGLCELSSSSSSLRAYQTWARQANAQGITWVNASGDSGGADCAAGNSGIGGLAVDTPASVPEITAVGGTTLTEASGVTYWSTTNSATDASALSYIPEVVWNDSTTNSPASGGGGASSFFTKPSWQTGAGVPNDGARDLPDISLAASASRNGYIVYNNAVATVYGGTSAGTPAFAGVLALLNQLQARGANSVSGQGNLGPRLYALSQTTPLAFHDITTGHNRVTITCRTTTRNCVDGTFGYDAAAGFDLATGLGSIDAYKFVTSWAGTEGSLVRSAAGMTLSSSAATISAADRVTVTAAVTAVNGGVPGGSVTFRIGSATLGTANLQAQSNRAVVTFQITGADLVVGANTIQAEYGGDAFFTGATASVTVTVPRATTGAPSISGFTNAASFRTSYAPGMLLSIFGSQLAPANWSATRVPLPTQMAGVSVTVNGTVAPLLYVSPSQLNIQLPYEVAAGQAATVVVTNNGQTASGSLTAAAAAPGIFVDSQFAPVPNATARRGDTVTLFVTGAGAMSPSISTGAAPSATTAVRDLPRSVQLLTVTVGGLPAAIQFSGIPSGLVGVVQVNYQVPDGVSLGANAVEVQVGTVRSATATLTILP